MAAFATPTYASSAKKDWLVWAKLSAYWHAVGGTVASVNQVSMTASNMRADARQGSNPQDV
jgi:hypothetical protein